MKDDSRAAARAALLDPDAQRLREECLARLVAGLEKAGEQLHVAGALFGPPPAAAGDARDAHLVGMGYVAMTSAALLKGAQSGLGERNAYAASALLRQVVEVEYLAWAFAEDQAEAGSWLRSSRDQRLARWQPRHLRERSGDRFRGKDYARHCEQGGHPTPEGCAALINGSWDVNRAGLTCDALVHGRSTWHYLVVAVDGYAASGGWDSEHLLPRDQRVSAHNAVESWWEYDPFRPFIESDTFG